MDVADTPIASAAPPPPQPQLLERSVSQLSTKSGTSVRSSSRSTTVRGRTKRLPSTISSSASSIAASDKSLTSFPSFSPESPKPIRDFTSPPSLAAMGGDQAPTRPSRNVSGGRRVDRSSGRRTSPTTGSASGDDTLTADDPTGARDALSQQNARNALFEDAPISTQKIPGALHAANDEHIDRLVARHGATGLVRMVATDLAQRDAQIALLRRKADERERALRKIIIECGLSNLELETRLRAIETETRASRPGNPRAESGLTDLMSDAMQDTVSFNAYGQNDMDATIRASSTASLASAHGSNGSSSNNNNNRGTLRGWKDFLWGGSTRNRSSVASSVNGDDKPPPAVVRANSSADRRPGLQDDLFSPPAADDASIKSASRASSIHSGPPGARKTSMASSLMRLVAGGAINTRENDGARGRSSSASTPQAHAIRESSAASSRTAQSTRSVSIQGGPKALMAMRRAAPTAPPTAAARAVIHDRWDTMGSSPPNPASSRQESYGPVEMDAILPPESQPPTLSHMYRNYGHSEFLTDSFGFIYDQRRKKRQRDAAQMARHIKRGSRTEMLTNGRSGISPALVDETPTTPVGEEGAESPSSTEERPEEEKQPKRWQDYLKLATFPTELLSHTPTIGAQSLEVLEAADLGKDDAAAADTARSPGLITTDERGFVPVASTTTSVAELDATPPVESDAPTAASGKEDSEPVRLLLQHMGELHESLQRERTVRWNEFLRKVRAERRRDGEAAAAAALAAAEARYERPSVVLPEASLADGELIGITGLGIKGRVGRAKQSELRSLVLGGVPVAYRAKIWSECSGASTLRVPGYYQDVIARSDEQDDANIVSQIQMDINRTLTDNIFFRKGPGVAKLNEVLVAYARRNPDVGYCQGMNLIAANLLLIMPSAEEAFWVLASIIENILPGGYYDHSLLTSRADQQVLRRYVAEVLPRLSAHLEELSIELEALTFQWFLSVFTDLLCAEALFRVWDVVLCMGEGSTFLFQVALALLKLNEPQLLRCDAPAAVYTYINHQMTNHAISIDNMIKASDALRRVVRREDVEARREEAIRAEKDLARAREEANEARKRAKSVGSDAAKQTAAPEGVQQAEGEGEAAAAGGDAGATAEDGAQQQ